MIINRQHIYYLCLVLLSAVLLVSETTSIFKPAVLVLLSFLMLPRPATLLSVLFVSSWSISFAAFPGLSAFFYYLVLFVVSVVADNKQEGLLLKTPRFVLFAALFAVWIVVTGFLSVSREIYMPIKLALFIVPVLLFSRLKVHDIVFLRFLLSQIAAFFTLYFLTISLFFPVEYLLENVGGDHQTTEILHSFRSDMNPNTAALVIVAIYTILYCEAFRTKKFRLIALAFLNFISLMYLGSRTAFFTAGIITVAYFIVWKTSPVKKGFVLLLLCFFLWGVYSASSLFERSQRLVFSSFQEDQGSGRFIKWELYFHDIIPDNYVKGIGYGNYDSYGYDESDADNLYVDLLCQTGIVGLLLFLSFYISSLVHFCKSKAYKREFGFLIAYFLAFLLVGFGESVFDTPLFWYWASLSLLPLNEQLGNNREYNTSSKK